MAQFGAQLPMLIRGFYYEGWDPTGKPLRVRHKEQFLDSIAQQLGGNERFDERIALERIARAVFTVLAQRISSGEIEDVKHVVPDEIRALWP